MKEQFKEIKIPFGAKDSELCGWEYTIPEGMEATIVDNKIVVKKKESEDERIRKELLKHLKEGADGYEPAGGSEDYKRWLVWLEQNPTDNDIKEALRTEYEKGRADAIAEMQNAWSEEDEMMLECILDKIGDLGTGEMCKLWLKKKLKG